jgi:putative nucleotidyltransferase with HDIG domain
VRFYASLNSSRDPLSTVESGSLKWQIESKTFKAIQENAHLLQFISKERIRDELIKILESPLAYEGVLLLHQTGLLKYIIPELEKGVGVAQNRHHIYTIFQHSLMALKYAAKYNYNLNVRLAALFHDIAKPEVKKGEGPDATFYNHDIVGAKIVIRILSRLKFPGKITEKVATLVRHHMFFYDPKTVTESSVRRLLRKVGPENIDELIQLRICDRKGMGRPKAKPYRLRHLEYVISKVSKDPLSVKMLKVNGQDVMKILNIKPGPKVGLILNALLAEVIDDPSKNKKAHLEKRVKELGNFSDEELKKMEKKVEEKKMEIELEEKRKFHVE